MDFYTDVLTELANSSKFAKPQEVHWVLFPKNLDSKINDTGLDRTEICARIYRIFRDFDFFELDKLDFYANYQDLGLDSLDWTAVVTSIEQEFHIAFPDTFFEHLTTLNQFVEQIEKDEFAY